MNTMESLMVLRAAFPQQQIPDVTLHLYADMLSDVQPDALERAVRDLIKAVQWFPSVAEIRETVRHIVNPRAYFGVHGGPALPGTRKQDSVPMPPELKARWNAVLEKVGKEKEARAKAVEQMPEPEPRRKMRPDLYCQGTGKMAVNGKCPDCGAVGELSPPEWFAPMVEHD